MAGSNYRDTVHLHADDLVDSILNGEVSDSDGVTEYLEQGVDGCQDVIYTGKALQVLVDSSSWLQAEEELGEGATTAGDLCATISRYAYFALLADVRECLSYRYNLEDFDRFDFDTDSEDMKELRETRAKVQAE